MAIAWLISKARIKEVRRKRKGTGKEAFGQ
jgi:hypothetical protein